MSEKEQEINAKYCPRCCTDVEPEVITTEDAKAPFPSKYQRCPKCHKYFGPC